MSDSKARAGFEGAVSPRAVDPSDSDSKSSDSSSDSEGAPLPPHAQRQASSSLRKLVVAFLALNAFAIGTFFVFMNWASSSQDEHARRYIPVRRSMCCCGARKGEGVVHCCSSSSSRGCVCMCWWATRTRGVLAGVEGDSGRLAASATCACMQLGVFARHASVCMWLLRVIADVGVPGSCRPKGVARGSHGRRFGFAITPCTRP